MGKSTMGGSVEHTGNVELLTKDQKKFLSGILGSSSKGAAKAYKDLLKRPDEPNLKKMLDPSRNVYERLMSEGDDMSAFKTGVVDPMMMNYNQQVLPGLQQRFVDQNAGSSSALNQALAQSAGDLTTQMGSLYLPFKQNQQNMLLNAAQGNASLTNPYMDMYKTQFGGRLSALSGLGGLAGQQTFTPMIHQTEGIAGPLINAAGSAAAAAAMMSSEKVKENISPYEKGLEIVKDLSVKSYDYKPEVGGAKNKVGVIAETLPDELCSNVNGIRCVDLYGLISILINSVKELNEKIERLEK
jgi:hypothetical protein